MPRQVTNAVLLEKLNNQSERQKDLMDKVDKLETKVTQNFASMASVLQEGYATKTDVSNIEKELDKKISKETMKPYLWALNTLAALMFTGAIYLIGRMVLEFLRGGPPQ